MPAPEIEKHIAFTCREERNIRRMADHIVSHLMQDFIVEIPPLYWQTESTLKRHVYRLKKTFGRLFPEKGSIHSELVIINGENTQRIKWLNKKDELAILTSESPYEIIDANEADFIILTLTK